MKPVDVLKNIFYRTSPILCSYGSLQRSVRLYVLPQDMMLPRSCLDFLRDFLLLFSLLCRELLWTI